MGKAKSIKILKGVSFLRKRGAASVGEETGYLVLSAELIT